MTQDDRENGSSYFDRISCGTISVWLQFLAAFMVRMKLVRGCVWCHRFFIATTLAIHFIIFLRVFVSTNFIFLKSFDANYKMCFIFELLFNSSRKMWLISTMQSEDW